MSDSLRQELLDIFVGRATRRYGLSDVNQLQHALQAAALAEADWLAERFGPEVSEPVRLHVAAKRYLCTIEPDYFGKLAADSVRSLTLQGGLMSAGEVEAFRAQPLHGEAVRLRRFDEMAKDPRAATPDFDHYLRHVEGCRVR